MERKKKEEKLKMKAEKEARKVSSPRTLPCALNLFHSLTHSLRLHIVGHKTLLFRRQGAPHGAHSHCL